MNKRGQGLPLTTVIIAILVVLVLVLVIVIFLGGMAGVSERIRGTWSKSIAGTDVTLAVKSCQTYCEQAKMLPESLRKKSAYCRTTFYLDTDNDGEAEKTKDTTGKERYINFHCHQKPLNINCEGIRSSEENKCREGTPAEFAEEEGVG